MKKPLIAIVLLMAALAVGYLYYSRSGSTEPEGLLRASGTVEVTEVKAALKVSGRLAEMIVQEGDTVKRGQRIASVEGWDYAAQLTQARAALAEAEARLEDLRTGARQQEILQSEAAHEAAQAALHKATQDFGRRDKLHQSGSVSDSDHDAARTAQELAEANLKAAREKLALLKEGPRPKEVSAAESRVAQARALYDLAERRFYDAILTAPLDSVVLARHAEPGEVVAAGTTLYTLGDLARPWVKVYIREDKLGLLSLGQQAEVSIDSVKGRAFKGTVTHISSEAEFTPKNVQTEEERVKLVFGVKVTVQDPEGRLKPGLPADVTIKVQ